MAITIPQSIRDQLGDQASQDLAHLLDQTMAGEKLERMSFDMEIVKRDIARLSEGQDKLNQRFEAMEARFDERFAQIDQRFAQIDQRFVQIDQRFAQIDQRFAQIDARFDYVHDRFDEMNERLISSIRWTVGTIALFGTLITILMAVAEFAG